HELQRHDLRFPVHTANARIVATFSADDSGAGSAVTIVVRRVTVVGDSVVTVNIIDRPEILISVRGQGRGPRPDIVDQINVGIFNSAIQHRHNNLTTAFGSGPGLGNTNFR